MEVLDVSDGELDRYDADGLRQLVMHMTGTFLL